MTESQVYISFWFGLLARLNRFAELQKAGGCSSDCCSAAVLIMCVCASVCVCVFRSPGHYVTCAKNGARSNPETRQNVRKSHLAGDSPRWGLTSSRLIRLVRHNALVGYLNVSPALNMDCTCYSWHLLRTAFMASRIGAQYLALLHGPNYKGFDKRRQLKSCGC